MKIVREKISKLVLYVFPDDVELSLNDTLTMTNFIASDINSTDHEILTCQPPLAWVPGILAYDTDWEVLDRAAYDIAVPVPPKTARARARLALSRRGLLPAIEQAVDGAGGEALIWYQDAAEWFRDDPYVIQISSALGLTSEQIDDLFRYAESGI